MSEGTMMGGAEGAPPPAAGAGAGGTPAPPAPSPAPAAAAPSDWRAALPEDLRSSPTLQRFEGTPEGLVLLAKEHVGAQKLIGAEKIPVPGKDAEPEDWARVYQRLGRPEKPDQYDLGDFAPPEGLPWDADFQTEALGKLHEAGLNHQQVRSILSWFAGRQGEQWNNLRAAAEQGREATEQQLKAKYGTAFKARLDLGRRALVTATGGEEGANQIASIRLEDGTYLGNHPEFVEMFARLGDLVAEHGIVGEKSSRMSKTPEEAATEMRRLEGDPAFMAAYTTREHPEHEDAVRRMAGLYKAKGGGG